MPYEEDPYRRDDRPRRYAAEEMPAPRGRRYADEDDARGRRYAEDDMPAPRQRRGERFEEPAPPPRRRVDDYEDEPRRGRRAAADEPHGARSARYADDEPAPRGRRRADEEPRYDQAPPPRSRRYADDDVPRQRTGEFRTGDVRTTGEFPRGDYSTGEFRTGDIRTGDVGYDRPAPPRSRSSRYTDDEGVAPRARRGRGADVDRADSGRHSRSEFVDLAAPADPWGAQATDYPPDETPTLVDMASRRARRAEQQDGGRGGRRSKGRSSDNDVADDQYWRQLRGEAQ
jgi:hypothetical protein